jgi:hypothetical protein
VTVLKRIVCLANSRKMSERCLAGKELGAGSSPPWIRPVSSRPTQEVPLTLRRYGDGSEPKVLDVVEVPLLHHEPKSHQQENWLLDPARRWARAGRVTWDQAATFAEDPPALWDNGSSTREGTNDRVSEADAGRLSGSLYLLPLEGMRLRLYAPDPRDPFNRRVQAEFAHRGVDYRLRVTDPIVERRYLLRDEDSYSIGRCLVTVSLGEPFNGFCYKLVAAVIAQEPLP